jgi:hypothetical protein
MVRLTGGLLGVLGLWVAIWLPLVTVGAFAAEPSEQTLGDPDAPVTIIEYASLTCPHCAQFHNEVLPDLKERYIETGKVQLIYRDFPLDERALMAAALAHCAGPDRYFGFLDVLFETQSGSRSCFGKAHGFCPTRNQRHEHEVAQYALQVGRRQCDQNQ